MQRPVNHPATLEHFVPLFEPDRFFQSDKANAHSFECDELADENPLIENLHHHNNLGRVESSLLTEPFEQSKARMPLYLNERELACAETMVDSVYETRGLFKTSHVQVEMEYHPTFGNLKVAKLNQARVFPMH